MNKKISKIKKNEVPGNLELDPDFTKINGRLPAT